MGTWAAYVSINASCNKTDVVTHRYGPDVICAKKNSLFRMLKGLPPSWVGEPIQPVAACGDDKPTTRLWALCNLQNRLSHVVTEQDSRSRGSKSAASPVLIGRNLRIGTVPLPCRLWNSSRIQGERSRCRVAGEKPGVRWRVALSASCG